MIYYSPGKNAFYDDAIHGPVMVDVIDDERQATAETDAEAKDEAEYEAAFNSASATADTPMRSQFTRHFCDAVANPIMRRKANEASLIPPDAVAISDEEHARLMAEQAAGRSIVAGANGLPLTTELGRTAEDLLAAVRARRDRELAASDWTQLPDAATVLSAAKKKAWAEFRKKLRDLPAQVEAAIKGGIPTGIGSIDELLPEAPK